METHILKTIEQELSRYGKLDRRTFLKLAAISGLTITSVREAKAASNAKGKIVIIGVRYDPASLIDLEKAEITSIHIIAKTKKIRFLLFICFTTNSFALSTHAILSQGNTDRNIYQTLPTLVQKSFFIIPLYKNPISKYNQTNHT